MIKHLWISILEEQQKEFIDNKLIGNLWDDSLKGFNYSRYWDEVQTLYLDEEQEEKINDFCYALTEKYISYYDPDNFYDPDIFMNYKIGKLGEESVKSYLGDLINNVDYKLYESGDGGYDFYLKNKPSFKIQVKATCLLRVNNSKLEQLTNDHVNEIEIDIYCNPELYFEKLKWKISQNEKDKNNIAIFVVLIDPILGDEIRCQYRDEIFRFSYNFIIAGFQEMASLKADSDIKINELLYKGGLKGYLKYMSQ
jgi:hypothetical protein